MKGFETKLKPNATKKYAIAVAAIGICLVLFASQFLILNSNRTVANAEPSKQDQANAMLQQLESQQQVLDQASADYGDALAEKERAQAQVDECNAVLDECSGKISKLQNKLAVRAKDMYRNGTTSVVDIFLGASSFWDLANSLDIVNKLNNQDAAMVEESKELHQQAENAKAEKEESLATAERKTSEAYQIKANAESITANLQSQYNSLSAEAAAALQQQQAQAAAAAQATAQQEQQSSGGGGTGGGGGGTGGGGGGTGGGGGGGASGGDSSILGRAQSQIGKPYVWGGVGPDGYDCSGLVSYSCCGAHTRIGTTTTFMGWARVSSPSAGNIWTNSYHCGIATGGGRGMVHAPTFGQTVSYGSASGDMICVKY